MNAPSTVAIVMDGNRRWAKKNNLPISQGHRAGIESLTRIAKSAKKFGIKNLVVYAFSTENWNRKKFEVNALMNLINFGADIKLDELVANEVKIEFIGDLDALPKTARQALHHCVDATKSFNDFTLTVALNYGSSWDFVHAISNASKNKKLINESNLLEFTSLTNQVDIFIRTGGEQRLSNFLLPNLAYSELFFVEKMWPDFIEADLIEILKEFENRKRRFGV